MNLKNFTAQVRVIFDFANLLKKFNNRLTLTTRNPTALKRNKSTHNFLTSKLLPTKKLKKNGKMKIENVKLYGRTSNVKRLNDLRL